MDGCPGGWKPFSEALDLDYIAVCGKNGIKPCRYKQWVIPPEHNAEFVCHMEDVLALYHEPYDPLYRMVCLDETSKQLIKETCQPLPAQPGQARRYDYEYERNGTRNLFIFSEPLAGWRHVKVTERQTKRDWPHRMQQLVDGLYPEAERIHVVLDNLNTHNPTMLYEIFEAAEAGRLLGRLELHHTPKNGSWLNMGKIEFSVLTGQCLNRRIRDEETLRQEVAAWEASRNTCATAGNWQFTTDDARTRLAQWYPSIDA